MGVISSGLLFNRAKNSEIQKSTGHFARAVGRADRCFSHTYEPHRNRKYQTESVGFVAIADSLNVRTDDLLSDGQSGADPSRKEIEELLKGCTIQQMRVIRDIVKAAKIAFRKYMSE